MRPSAFDAWAIARILAGRPFAEPSNRVSAAFGSLVERLAATPADDLPTAWDLVLSTLGEDREAMVKAIAAADPDGHPPEDAAGPIRRANLGDVRRIMSEAQWLWPGWIPSARLSGISAAEGIGKTRLAMDLARRLWFGLEWPDGQPPSFPAGTRTLWVCADGQQDDLVAIGAAMGMPDEAISFNAPFDDPYDGTTLDGDESTSWFEESIRLVSPGLTFIDTLTYATSRDLCRANEVKDLMTPLRDICQKTQSAIIPLLHVSMDGHALGKRIKGLTRTILQLECPDPEESGRLKLSVSKSFAKKPPALGVTMNEAGNEYDSDPPAPAETNGPGRPSDKRDKAKGFIREQLSKHGTRKGVELRAAWEKNKGSRNTFDRAIRDLIETGEVGEKGGPGTGEQWTLSLINPELDPDYPF